jgi:predicted metalloprotease with PDZ domain
MAQAVACVPSTAEVRVRFCATKVEIYSGQSGTETGFFPSTSVFLCQYHYTTLHTYFYLNAIIIIRTSGRRL